MKKDIHTILLYICGLFITAIGSNLFLNANLGVAPSCTLALALTFLLPVHGYAFYNFLTNLGLLIGESVISRKLGRVQLIQFCLIFFYSVFIQTTAPLVSFLRTDILPLRILVSLLASLVMSLGTSCMITSGFAVLPTEGFINSIAEKRGKPFGRVRIYVEVTFTVVSSLISLALLHDLRVVGIGTVLAAFLNGTITGFILRYGFKSRR